MRRFDYFKPQSLKEAWAIKEKNPQALFIAGGTDLMVQIRNREIQAPALISLRSIPELAGLSNGSIMRIGAMTTISNLIQHPSVRKNLSILREAGRSLGSTQIRNVATIGGNLCNGSPCADMATPLLVLEAKVRLQSNRGCRDIPLDEFFIGPGKTSLRSGEILTDILIKPLSLGAKTVFLKRGRVKVDLSIVNVTVLLVIENRMCRKARIAAGSSAPVPLRLKNVEALLEGRVITQSLVAQAQELSSQYIMPITDIRASEEYRRLIVGFYVKRGIEKILKESQI